MTTRVILSVKKIAKVLHDEMIEVFFVLGTAVIVTGASLEWGLPIGLIIFGMILLLPVANKLR